ncbi:hypothetical protein QQG74_09705 [Micromonospora sp. FIMYZ51]|uniref:hypothetical protein n=1 Tax=Micromonospora sp. FIMYZ51 TaxID=3051832 RepID=UPI00311FED1F
MNIYSRHTTVGMPDTQHEQCLAWLRSLGLNPENFGVPFAIGYQPDGWYLHLSEVQYDEDGNTVIDHAKGQVATRPRVVRIPPDVEWPAWLDPTKEENAPA